MLPQSRGLGKEGGGWNCWGGARLNSVRVKVALDLLHDSRGQIRGVAREDNIAEVDLDVARTD